MVDVDMVGDAAALGKARPRFPVNQWVGLRHLFGEVVLLAAIDKEGRQVMLDDGRVLPISGLYSDMETMDDTTKVDSWNDAVCFVVEFPGETVVLIFSIEDITEGFMN